VSLLFDSLPQPKFRYSPAVRMGPFVKTAGMIGLDPETGTLVAGGAGAEFAQILRNLQALARDNGLALDTLMSATIYVTAFHRFAEVDAAWNEVFVAGGHLPARTAVGVSQLPVGAQVEAEFLFYLDDSRREGRA
jgi:2-iminobutanoate/2-iminopropanoate deaminase